MRTAVKTPVWKEASHTHTHNSTIERVFSKTLYIAISNMSLAPESLTLSNSMRSILRGAESVQDR